MGTSRPNTRLDEDTRLFDRTRGRRQVSGLYIIDDQMRVNVYSRANERNEGVDGWWWFDRGAYAVCLSIGIWYGVRCLVVVAKSVARDIVDEFWRRIRFFFFKGGRRSFTNERCVSLLVANCGISEEQIRQEMLDRSPRKRGVTIKQQGTRKGEEVYSCRTELRVRIIIEKRSSCSCGPSLSINRAKCISNTREHA